MIASAASELAPSVPDRIGTIPEAEALAGSEPLDGAGAGESADLHGAALQQAHWRRPLRLSSALERAENFLATAGFDRGPWLAVAFACGIAIWFVLPLHQQRTAFLLLKLGLSGGILALLKGDGTYPHLRQAIAAMALMVAAGCGTVWMKSALVGTRPIERPVVASVTGIVVARVEQPAQQRTRLTVETRDPLDPDRIVRVRVNVPVGKDAPAATEGAVVRLRARLMPPAPPMLPGGYDFARAAWFARLAATGTALDPVVVIRRDDAMGGWLDGLRRTLSAHVRARLSGSPGGIAAAFASGDRGGIAPADEEAMRNSGLTHLLSVSGLHVSAVIGATYLLALRLLALWPWLALRTRLPLVAGVISASTGVFYALLTGGEVPTLRSVLGAVLVLAAIALGREPLSLRLLAVAGLAVMLVWPEAVVGPSFQLSFAAVATIVAVHGAAPVRAWFARREEPRWARLLRNLGALLLTGIAIELALMPISLFHFHRAGVYGSLANLIAIPLTTFITMPLIALALLLDVVGLGAPVWWAVGLSLEGLLGLARFVAAIPGAVTTIPAMGNTAFALFLAGGLWLALWRGRARLWGLAPVVGGALWLALLTPPDVLVSGAGRHVAFTRLVPGNLVVLRQSRSDFALDNLAETAGLEGPAILLEDVPHARCNADFCGVNVSRAEKKWHFLLARSADTVPLRDLAAACARADVVIAARRLPRSCRPLELKIDRALLARTGGLSLDLATHRIATVAATQGDHGWWHSQAGEPFAWSPWSRPGQSK